MSKLTKRIRYMERATKASDELYQHVRAVFPKDFDQDRCGHDILRDLLDELRYRRAKEIGSVAESVPETFRVRITKPTKWPHFWYNDKIGEIFEVKAWKKEPDSWLLLDESKAIAKSDCEIVPEDQPEAEAQSQLCEKSQYTDHTKNCGYWVTNVCNCTERPQAEQKPVRELLCQECDREYSVWFAHNDLWNEACRDKHFLCPNCFVSVTEQKIGKQIWTVRIASSEKSDAMQDALDSIPIYNRPHPFKGETDYACSMCGRREGDSIHKVQPFYEPEKEQEAPEVVRNVTEAFKWWDEQNHAVAENFAARDVKICPHCRGEMPRSSDIEYHFKGFCSDHKSWSAAVKAQYSIEFWFASLPAIIYPHCPYSQKHAKCPTCDLDMCEINLADHDIHFRSECVKPEVSNEK